MLVLCYGIPKSGSTLAYELVTGILRTGGFDQPFICNDRVPAERVDPSTTRNYIERVTRDKIQDVLAKIRPEQKIVFKTHSPFPDGLFGWLEELQDGGQLQVVASYRDPRDNSLSALDAGERARKNGQGAFAKIATLDVAAKNIEARIKDFRKWAALRGTLRLYYDTVAFSPDVAIDAIEKVFNVTSDRERVKTYAFKEAKTQKNLARKERYKDELTKEQNARLSVLFREFIKQACERDNQAWYEKKRQRLIAK